MTERAAGDWAAGDWAARVACILAPNPSPLTGAGTNTYLVAGEPAGCAIIDAGPASEAHLGAVAEAASAHGGATAILVTHGHPDHAEGAARLRALTGAPVLAASRDGVQAADVLLDDGDEREIGGRRLVALHTPGHRFDHLCFWLPDAGALFAGDLVAGEGTVVIAPPEGDLGAYLASLRRVRALHLRVIFPGHGPPIARPDELLDGYLRHRAAREAEILAALAGGIGTVPELVSCIYAGVDPALHPLAALTVRAHLLKLRGEGRATVAQGEAGDERWQEWR